jgi:hypothetical protein
MKKLSTEYCLKLISLSANQNIQSVTWKLIDILHLVKLKDDFYFIPVYYIMMI